MSQLQQITIPVELELTPRSRAVMDAPYKALGTQFKSDDSGSTSKPALQPGEHYAGVVLDEAGNVKHHLVLMAARGTDLTWEKALAWAKSVGGELPTRQEQALLYANCKPHLKTAWHWSCEAYEEDASFAWVCYFISGGQFSNRKSYEGSAVAVRLIPLTA